MAAILDRQHTGKSAHSTDLGAWADLDGDVQQDLEEREALLTPYYLLEAEGWLRQRGHAVIPISDGAYWERHARAATYARQLPDTRFAYVAAHLNTAEPPGDYGAIFFDYRSSNGEDLAEAIAATLASRCPELARVRVIPARHDDWTASAYATIQGIYAGPANLSAVTYEPCFLNQPQHAALLGEAGLRRLGQALAEGVHAWAE